MSPATSPRPEGRSAPSNAPRFGTPTTLRELVDGYMSAYAGRDRSRIAQLARWCELLGERPFAPASPTTTSSRPWRRFLANPPGSTTVGTPAVGRSSGQSRGIAPPLPSTGTTPPCLRSLPGQSRSASPLAARKIPAGRSSGRRMAWSDSCRPRSGNGCSRPAESPPGLVSTSSSSWR
jgi:hypothetical protein